MRPLMISPFAVVRTTVALSGPAPVEHVESFGSISAMIGTQIGDVDAIERQATGLEAIVVTGDAIAIDGGAMRGRGRRR